MDFKDLWEPWYSPSEMHPISPPPTRKAKAPGSPDTSVSDLHSIFICKDDLFNNSNPARRIVVISWEQNKLSVVYRFTLPNSYEKVLFYRPIPYELRHEYDVVGHIPIIFKVNLKRTILQLWRWGGFPVHINSDPNEHN